MSPISLGFFYLGDILFILLYLFLWSQSKNKEMRSLFFIIIKTSHIVLVLGKVGSSLYQNLDNSDKGSFFSSLEEEKNERDLKWPEERQAKSKRKIGLSFMFWPAGLLSLNNNRNYY